LIKDNSGQKETGQATEQKRSSALPRFIYSWQLAVHAGILTTGYFSFFSDVGITEIYSS
jgi:hypothetical protein